VSVLGKPFQSSLIFVGEARSLPRVEHLKGAAPTLPANIRLGWKGLPRKNTLAYNENLQITATNSFIAQASGRLQPSVIFYRV
jgi:hypothetical protein